MTADRRQSSLGERVKELRAEQGESQKGLASTLKKSVSWVSQVERGEIEVRDLGTLQRIAAALGATSRELVELQLGEAAGEAERQRPYVEELRLVLAGHPAPQAVFGTTTKRPATVVVENLERRTVRAWELVHAASYEQLGPLLADLIPRLELASRVGSDLDRQRVLPLLADAYQAAAAMLVKVGDHGAGWIAADRAIAAAERCGDRHLMMAGQYRMAHTLYGAEERELAVHVLRQAIRPAKELRTGDDLGLVSLTGACALLLTILEARDGQGDAAERNLQLARRLAGIVGPGRNEYGTEFGPANVAVHAVAVAVELGNASDALRLASGLDTAGLSPERRARHLVDLARAHAQRRQVDQAVRALERAEALAPDEVRELRVVRQLLGDLEHLPAGAPLLACARCGSGSPATSRKTVASRRPLGAGGRARRHHRRATASRGGLPRAVTQARMPMRLPIDTSAMTFMAAGGPEPVVEFDTRNPRVSPDGQPLYAVSLVALGPDGAEVVAVKVGGEPKGVGQGVTVKVSGLVATPWSIGERSGVSFRAERIEVAVGAGRQAS